MSCKHANNQFALHFLYTKLSYIAPTDYNPMIWTIYKMLFKLLPFINHIDAATFNQVCTYQSNQAFCTRTFATIRSGNARMYLS